MTRRPARGSRPGSCTAASAASSSGFNRARHAVLEATILATRTHLLPMDQIREEFARLQVIVDKTAGPREQEAMAFVTEYVRGR